MGDRFVGAGWGGREVEKLIKYFAGIAVYTGKPAAISTAQARRPTPPSCCVGKHPVCLQNAAPLPGAVACEWPAPPGSLAKPHEPVLYGLFFLPIFAIAFV